MNQRQWKDLLTILKQGDTRPGRVVLAVVRSRLDVVLFELPVLDGTPPPHNPLCGFVQDAVRVLTRPTSREIADLLRLPSEVVRSVLGTLRQAGGARCDAAGRWHVPAGATAFGTDENSPPAPRRVRRLLCYWPGGGVVLPARPRLRTRDLMELDAHADQSELKGWYAGCVEWQATERQARGTTAIRLLPLADQAPADDEADGPVTPDEVLTLRCQLEVIAIAWAARRGCVWEVTSRLWCRPVADGSPAGSLSAGEEFTGLTVLERLMGPEVRLDALGTLFDDHPERWRALFLHPEKTHRLRRRLDADAPAFLTTDAGDRRWGWVASILSDHTFLLVGPGEGDHHQDVASGGRNEEPVVDRPPDAPPIR
jgi:hypothetical protein